MALGVGAGVEATMYYLTRYMDVVATDLYNDAGIWQQEWCKPDMMHNPERYAPSPDYVWNPLRLVMQHVDGRKLPYPDNTFDVVFSASSIEHFGSLEDIARAASEIGRVLKVGGMAVLSTELCLNPHAIHSSIRLSPATKFFTRSEIIEYIVAPSGLALVDELRTRLIEPIEFVSFSSIEHAIHTTPHLYVRHESGCEYTSVHLAMVKPTEFKSAL
jgi:SAM-dependent methyltransferase